VSKLNLLFAAIAAIVLFLFGLQEFSREIRSIGGDSLSAWLGRLTRHRWQGVLLGGLATVVLQSSSAVTALAVALVDAGTISFRSSLGILLGANVGSTSTAWLVSLKLTGIGPFFIVFGTILSALRTRWKIFGKAAFYFGFIFFSLDLVSGSLKPLQELPAVREMLAGARSPLMGVVAGIVITALVQASSITTGLAILLVQQGMLAAAAAIPIVMGANIGTTSTALIASIGMARTARRTALANLVFNILGVALFLPFLDPFSNAMVEFSSSPGLAVAWAHLVFNLVMMSVMLMLLKIFEGWIPE
jgi:phosphate:Na+ symporter